MKLQFFFQMFGETVACDDGVTFCNISVVWKYAEEDCVELTNCPLWPCETKKCTHTIVPTPTYCQESQCWTNDKPIGKSKITFFDKSLSVPMPVCKQT